MKSQEETYEEKRLRNIAERKEKFTKDKWDELKLGASDKNQVLFLIFLCIFSMNLPMANLGLKEMGKFFWEDREKGGKSRKREGQG